jgi:hypothetical protein
VSLRMPFALAACAADTSRGHGSKLLAFQDAFVLGRRSAYYIPRAAPVLTDSTVESSRNTVRKYQDTIQNPYQSRPPQPLAAPLRRLDWNRHILGQPGQSASGRFGWSSTVSGKLPMTGKSPSSSCLFAQDRLRAASEALAHG